MSTQNSDVVAFVNGTDTAEVRAEAEINFPDWQTYLKVHNVTIYNQTLTRFTQLKSGEDPSKDPSLPTYPEYDLFRVDLDDGTSVERAAFLTDFPDEQRSSIGEDMGVTLINGRLAGNQTLGYLTNIPLVYAVGDNNIDLSTNVPHALYSGKRAAVYLHGKAFPVGTIPVKSNTKLTPACVVALARLESAAEITAAKNGTLVVNKRAALNLDPRAVWNEMNAPRGDIFHLENFDSA